jgi:hypothetical protein
MSKEHTASIFSGKMCFCPENVVILLHQDTGKCTLCKISKGVCHQIVAVDYVIIKKLLNSSFQHTVGTKCTRPFFSQMTHQLYDIPLEMFQTENIYQTTRCQSPEDNNLNFYTHKNCRSHQFKINCTTG